MNSGVESYENGIRSIQEKFPSYQTSKNILSFIPTRHVLFIKVYKKDYWKLAYYLPYLGTQIRYYQKSENSNLRKFYSEEEIQIYCDMNHYQRVNTWLELKQIANTNLEWQHQAS